MNRAELRAFTDNRRLLMKLLVVVAMMFGFGYALVPMYRVICDALVINVLSLSEQRVATASVSGRANCAIAARSSPESPLNS